LWLSATWPCCPECLGDLFWSLMCRSMSDDDDPGRPLGNCLLPPDALGWPPIPLPALNPEGHRVNVRLVELPDGTLREMLQRGAAACGLTGHRGILWAVAMGDVFEDVGVRTAWDFVDSS
jgi:hypothetical protein